MPEAWPGTEAKGVRDSPLPSLPCSPTWNSIDPQARMSAELTPVAWDDGRQLQHPSGHTRHG